MGSRRVRRVSPITGLPPPPGRWPSSRAPARGGMSAAMSMAPTPTCKWLGHSALSEGLRQYPSAPFPSGSPVRPLPIGMPPQHDPLPPRELSAAPADRKAAHPSLCRDSRALEQFPVALEELLRCIDRKTLPETPWRDGKWCFPSLVRRSTWPVLPDIPPFRPPRPRRRRCSAPPGRTPPRSDGLANRDPGTCPRSHAPGSGPTRGPAAPGPPV